MTEFLFSRIYCELFPERGRRSLFISGHTLRLLDRCIRDYVGELLKEVVKKASLSRRYKVRVTCSGTFN